MNPIAGISDFGSFPSSPGAYYVDLGVYKTTRITERVSIQIQSEFFNMLNHSNMWITRSDNDVPSITGGCYGNVVQQCAVVHAEKGVPPIDANERRNIQLALKVI